MRQTGQRARVVAGLMALCVLAGACSSDSKKAATTAPMVRHRLPGQDTGPAVQDDWGYHR